MKFKNGLPVVMSCAAVCVFAVSQSILAPLVLLIGKEFGHGIAWSGLFFAAYYGLNIIACPFAGRLISALGDHYPVSLGLAVFAAASLLLSCADRFLFVCLGFAALGVAAVFVLLAGIEAVSVFTGRVHADCVMGTAVLMGFVAAGGAVYTALMLVRDYSWRQIYFFLGVAVAGLALLHAVIPFPKTAPDEGWQEELGSALRLRRMYPSYFMLFLYAGAEAIATGWMGGYMTRSLGYTSIIAAIAAVLMWTCMACGRALCFRFAASVPAGRLVTILLAILILSLGLCVIVPDGRLFWFAVSGIGVGLSCLWPLLLRTTLGRENGGATLSVLLLWECAGAAVLPAAVGLLGSQAGMRTVMYLAALLFTAVGVLMWHILSGQRESVRARAVRRTEKPAAKKTEPWESSAELWEGADEPWDELEGIWEDEEEPWDGVG